jgi:hypothetical protein
LKHWHLYLAKFDIVNDITHGSEAADYRVFLGGLGGRGLADLGRLASGS